MTQPILQPYRKFQIPFIKQLVGQDKYYLVIQSYRRARDELDHTKRPILLTPYKETGEAAKHYLQLKSKQDPHAAFVDIRKEKVMDRLTAMCDGSVNDVPYISVVANMDYVTTFLRRHYYEKYRLWVKKNRPHWIIREHNAVEPNFETVMGTPMVKLTWGKHSALVSLQELEAM